MRGGIRAEREVIFFGGVSQLIEDDSGLHAGDAPTGIDLEDLSHVLREIEDDGDVAALSGERGASAAAEERSIEFATGRNGREHIIGVGGNDDANRNLPVVGAVCRVERTSAVVETNFPANLRTQTFGECVGHRVCRRRCYFDPFVTFVILNLLPSPLCSI